MRSVFNVWSERRIGHNFVKKIEYAGCLARTLIRESDIVQM